MPRPDLCGNGQGNEEVKHGHDATVGVLPTRHLQLVSS